MYSTIYLFFLSKDKVDKHVIDSIYKLFVLLVAWRLPEPEQSTI